ncbi:TPA: hypothetical protein NJ913_004359 [Vibrio parahaemolyticus]|nr:hypothetical protein [Vibrio parahaemolyticus]
MHPLQNGSQVTERPANKPVSGAAGYFTESGENNVPSYPGADWFNNVIDEFLNSLNAVGISFSNSSVNNLSLCFDKVFSSSLKLLGEDSVLFFGNDNQNVKAGDVLPSSTTHLVLDSSVKWIALSDEMDFSGKTVQVIDSFTVIFTDGSRSPLLPPEVKFSKVVTPVMFGADPKGVVFPTAISLALDPSLQPIVSNSDSSDAIQDMIDYCSPYQWAGSVPNTKKSLGQVRASAKGIGNFRITKPVMLNPFFKWEGQKKGAFFGQKGGTMIYADFSDKDNYALDTAPMADDGTRPLGASYSKGDWDNGNNVGCMGVWLDGLQVFVPEAHNLKGCVNRQISQESVITNCSFAGANEGVNSSVCWGGTVNNNHIEARAVGLGFINDVTTDDVENNYVSILGVKPSPSDYDYRSWADSGLNGLTANIASLASQPHLSDNTFEGGEVAVISQSPLSLLAYDNYIEGSSYAYLYAVNTGNCDIKLGYTYTVNASALRLIGSNQSKINLDLGGVGTSNLKALLSEGAGNQAILNVRRSTKGNLPGNYIEAVNIADLSSNGVIDIYVDPNGDDNAWGYNPGQKVKTIQEAIRRCRPNSRNLIHIDPGKLVTTKYTYGGSDVTNTREKGIYVEILCNGSTIQFSESFGQTQCIPLEDSTIKILQGVLDLSGAASSDNYRSALRTIGNCDVYLEDVDVNGAGSGRVLIGAQNGRGGLCRLSIKGGNYSSDVLLTHNSGQNKSFGWMLSSVGITGSPQKGATDGEIFSTLP